MSRSNRLACLTMGLCLVVPMSAGCAAVVSPAEATALGADSARPGPGPTSGANPPVIFAQTRSDLPVDPAARFGHLPNGMGYVLYRTSSPPGTASVYMRVGAGSAMEQENQRGLAHFIEHMAFQGTTNVPEGEMVRLLERDGLQFGADTNASTSFFETTYMLNLPVASDRIVDQALFLMRETAGNITFDPAAIDAERGVVLSEERVRANVGMRAGIAEMVTLLQGAKYPERLPIGLTHVLETAQRPEFVQFYEDFYRPEYTTLVVAGDVDLDRVETEIRTRFSDWRPGPQSAAARTDFGAVVTRTEPEAKVFIAEGLNDTLSMSWTKPPVGGVETRDKSFDDLMFSIATSILNERYARQAQASDSNFSQASLHQQDIAHTARLIGLNIVPKPGRDRAAFDQAMAILREYRVNGPTQEELERVMAAADQFYAQLTDAARTRRPQEVAGKIVEALSTQRVFQSPAQSLAEVTAWKPRITLAAVRAALTRFDPRDPPLIWRQGAKADAFDEAAMVEAYRDAMAAPVAAFQGHQTAAWPYTDFGVASAVVSRTPLPDVGATRVVFANGVVLTVKPTTFEDKAVHVSVNVGNGLLGIRPDQGATLFMARRLGLGAGGLGRLSAEDLGESLTGKTYGLGFSIGENATTLTGATTRTDLELQMQVLAAFMTDPGFRPDALTRLKTGLPSAYDLGRTSPDGVYGQVARGDLYGDDPRFSAPSQQDALAVDNDAIAALIKTQLGHGPVEVVIVGDITTDEAVQTVGRTLGALSRLPIAIAATGADRLRFPTGPLRETYSHEGRPDQNLSVIAWPTTDFYADPRQATALDVLAAVLTGRELEEVREKQGATYSVSTNSNTSDIFPGFGFIVTRAGVRPEVDQTFYDTVSSIVADLRTRPVTEDELLRARQPLIDGVRNARNSNGYWLTVLSGASREPRRVASTEAREHDLLSVTVEDIQKLAQTYLDMSRAVRIQVKPKTDI